MCANILTTLGNIGNSFLYFKTMATLRDIKQRIVAIKNTSKITSAMRMVAAAKLRRAQEAILAARPYSKKLSEILGNLASSVEEDYYHPLLRRPQKIRSVAVIVISSDRGLCGSFNTNVLRIAAQRVKAGIQQEFPDAQVSVIAVGKRSVQFFQRQSIPVIAAFPDIFQKLRFDTAQELAEIVLNGFSEEKFDHVEVIGNQFRSVMRQEVTTEQLLPIERKNQQQNKSAGVGEQSDYIFEPSRGDIMDILLPKYLTNQLWRSLLDSNAAENAARMVAMEAATKNSKDLTKSLQLKFNNLRQAAITKEMLEIVGGAEALKN